MNGLDPKEGYYRPARKPRHDSAEAHLDLAAVAMSCDRLDDAEKAFAAAANADPQCTEAYTGLGMIHQGRSDHQAAFDLYLKALDADGDNLLALLGLFQTSVEMGSFATIVHYLETYLANHPRDAAVLLCLATLYAREDKLLLARRTLLEALAVEPDNTDAVELLQQVRDALARSLTQGAATA